MTSFTQFVEKQRCAYHGRQIDPTNGEGELNATFGREHWSARLIDRVHWGLYLWHPFTKTDDQHGMWKLEQSTRANSYHDAVEFFAATWRRQAVSP